MRTSPPLLLPRDATSHDRRPISATLHAILAKRAMQQAIDQRPYTGWGRAGYAVSLGAMVGATGLWTHGLLVGTGRVFSGSSIAHAPTLSLSTVLSWAIARAMCALAGWLAPPRPAAPARARRSDSDAAS